MKKSIIKGVVFGIVFFIALFVINRIMNKGNTDMTAQMSPASLPMVYMSVGDVRYNALYGYTEEMNLASLRDNITVLNENRQTGVYIETYGEAVGSVSYELRSIDGERLIENETITDLTEEGTWLSGQIELKDLIEQEKEYSLTILIQKGDDSIIRYYTRVIWSPNSNVLEKLSFARDFHERTFDKEAAKEITRYLESNAQGDNTTFHKVDIHSSFNQITWGDLNVKRESEPIVNLTETDKQTANITMQYVVSTAGGKEKRYFYVEEFYRIRYTAERTYLLEYERSMTEFFDEDAAVYNENRIMLGITDENLPFVESEDGKILVFVNNNKLCTYNITANKLAVLFCFYDEDNADYRTICNRHSIKILDVDEAGNVAFAVYGYMNRGRHEGETGVQIYNYNSTLNTIEEALYIGYDKSYAILQEEMEDLLYMNQENRVYLKLESTVYKVNLTEQSYEKIEQSTVDGSLVISDTNKMMVWQTGTEIYASKELKLIDFNSGTQLSIPAQTGEYILPLGFMGEDVIYGKAYVNDIVTDAAGQVTFPMHSVNIMDAQGNILKSYSQAGYYVTECRIEANQIILSRVVRNEAGGYEETSEEHITNNALVKEGKNKINVIITEEYEKQIQFEVESDIDAKSLKVLTPKEVLFEGGNRLTLSGGQETERYYVYGLRGLQEIYLDASNAVNVAYGFSGAVLNDRGEYVWKKSSRASRNQIMAITEAEVTPEKNSVVVCLDTMLKYEGIIRNSEYLLAQGETIYSILEQNLEEAHVLDLRGCSLDSVLYYVNKDIPVFAYLRDGSAVLIIGFNDYNIVVMDPETGTIYKKGMNDSTEWFLENGNCFLTYIR